MRRSFISAKALMTASGSWAMTVKRIRAARSGCRTW